MQIDLPIPEAIDAYSDDLKKEIYEYLNQLNDTEKYVYKIAYEHLGASFHITRTNGFQEWKQKRKN